MVSQQELQEKQKALVESEQKMQMLGNQVATLEARAAGYNKEGKRSMLTERELVETAEGSRVYKSVGRMFVLRSKDSLIEEQKKRQTTCEEEVKKALSLLETQKKKLGEANEDFNKLYISFTEDLKKK